MSWFTNFLSGFSNTNATSPPSFEAANSRVEDHKTSVTATQYFKQVSQPETNRGRPSYLSVGKLPKETQKWWDSLPPADPPSLPASNMPEECRKWWDSLPPADPPSLPASNMPEECGKWWDSLLPAK